ncbi:hypothetical protein AB0D49_29755 [Streptomyces sp. NPDC048290]|uniref:hypothetical protein n=1 Tax=Streptomyces sp. NPDC048290 TaxID=3155811 RepID=UPI00344293FA
MGSGVRKDREPGAEAGPSSGDGRGVTPTDVLADGLDGGEYAGTYVRKGSIRAAIENIKAMEGLAPEDPARRRYEDALRALRPSLIALELFDHFTPLDPAVAAIFEG